MVTVAVAKYPNVYSRWYLILLRSHNLKQLKRTNKKKENCKIS